jgi:hypothetical protein
MLRGVGKGEPMIVVCGVPVRTFIELAGPGVFVKANVAWMLLAL